jgi:hypothetical protein
MSTALNAIIDDVKPHQLVMTAAILKASLEKAAVKETSQLSNDDYWKCGLPTMRSKSTTNFEMRERPGLL